MLSSSIISLNNISKCYRLYQNPQDRLKQIFFPWRKKYYKEFWALKNITLEIPKGISLGVVGRNGAGKSTLLQIISGILAATSGTATISGRVAALLELGTGFNPEFSGSENVYLNGAILGLSQSQIKERFDQIISFADIGEFINQPVKTYSSGMLVRLAFAVAAHVDPEILIIDEALSVGDAKFQTKCFRKFEEFRRTGKTIIFVSHSPDQIVRHCERAILLEAGTVICDDDPKTVTNKYLSLLFDTSVVSQNYMQTSLANKIEISCSLNDFLNDQDKEDKTNLRKGYNKAEFRWGNQAAEIIDYFVSNEQALNKNHFESGEKINVYAKIKFNRKVLAPIFGLTIKTPDGVTVYGANSLELSSSSLTTIHEDETISNIQFTFTASLVSGHYLVSIGVAESNERDLVPLDRRYDLFEIYITNQQRSYGIADLGMKINVS